MESEKRPSAALKDGRADGPEHGQEREQAQEPAVRTQPPPTEQQQQQKQEQQLRRANAAVPDGGWRAWSQVAASFVVMVSTYGLLNSFGMFQTYYETELLAGRTSSDISWIGSLQGALLLVLGCVSGPLFDAGYFRHLAAAGQALVVLGMFMTSLARTYWQVVLVQGVCVGVGCGLVFLPSAAVLSQYFARRRAIALGIQSSGSPLAGIVFPVIFNHLRPRVGFPWATRVIAFILLGLAAVPLSVLRPRVRPDGTIRGDGGGGAGSGVVVVVAKHAAPSVNYGAFREALRDRAFMLFGAGAFLAFLGLYVPYFYITLYALRYGLCPAGFDPGYLVTLLNAGSVFGRLLPNFAADHVGSLNMLTGMTLAGSAVSLGWLGVRGFGPAVVFAVLFGFFNGGMTSLPPSVVAQLTPDLGHLGSRMGLNFLFFGVSTLIGTPVAGAILGSGQSDDDWRGLILYTGLTMAAAVGVLAASEVTTRRRLARLRKSEGGNSTE